MSQTKSNCVVSSSPTFKPEPDFAMKVFRIITELERELGTPMSPGQIRARLRAKLGLHKGDASFQIRLVMHRGFLELSPADKRYRVCQAAVREYLEAQG